MPDSPARTCPTCATAIPASFPQGFCPKCMLASATPAAAAEVADGDKTLAVPAPTPSQNLRPGGVPSLDMLRCIFPDLEILDMLGAGGMGAVYKARQPRLNRLVALKIMVAASGHETDFALRFEREAQVLARLSHPHIVILYDFGELGPERTGADPLFYFLMEYVDGTDLGQLIKSKELQPAQALAIVPQICEALQYAHDQGITHRDIKPANILIDKRGTVKIADFGLAKMITGTEESLMTGLTQTGTAMGTPHYMAPEQWEHPQQVDHRADIYALGVVFYEMLTGERPAGVFEPPSKKTKPPVDKKLDGVVMRAMDKNPDRRYQQAGQIGDDVTRISGANKSRPASANDAPQPKRGLLKPLLALGVAALLAVGGWMLWQGEPPAAVTSKTTHGGPSAPPPAADLPKHEWVKVDWPGQKILSGGKTSRELTREEITKGGGLRLVKDDLWIGGQVPRIGKVQNGGIRLRWKRLAERGSFNVCLRGDGKANVVLWGSGATIKYGSGNRLGSIPHGGMAPVGEEMLMEFVCVGRQLIMKCDGIVTGTLELPEAAPADFLRFQGSEVIVTQAELINLDHLSEAEALKLAGVEVSVTAPQATLTWGGSRYAFVDEKLPWTEARKRAEAAGGRLAVFETEGEERAVREHYRAMPNKQRYWIGGHVEKGSQEIRWITGAPVGKVAWGAGHPAWRNNPASPEAQSEGLLFAGALGVELIQEGVDRWIIIQPEYKTGLGFILEWNEAAAKTPEAVTPTPSTTKAAPFVNSLGMKFVPVPITGGATDGQRVLFSIWETRMQDYEVFVKETKREWAKPGFTQEPTHPACMVTLGDAEAFCLWLTERERKAGELPATVAYRLPSDHEWSCAIGIGAQEDAALSSWDKSGKLPGHPWGSAWPPPAGAGNFNGDEAPWSAAGGKLTGYRDAFPNTGPVGSFAANALGLHDLIGNVWELCPKPDSNGQQSILRGGSCQDVRPDSLTSSKRGFQSVDKFHSNIGFRIVLEPAAAPSPSVSPSSAATPPPFTDREAAEWVLGLGYEACNVKVLKAGKLIEVRKLADLPVEPWVILELRVNLSPKNQPELWGQVTDAVVLRLTGLKALKILDLRGNLSGASLKVLAHHPGLESLLFEGLTLKTDDLGHLRASPLPALRFHQLNVADPESLAVLATMPNLQELQLAECLAPALVAALPKLPKLEKLRANASKDLRDEDLPLLVERFPQLTLLQPWGAKKLRGTTFSSLMALKRLTYLSLTDTSVNDEGLAQIAGMPQLLTLELGQTRITDACLPTLKSFPKLEFLHVFQTELTDAALLELASIPTLKRLTVKMQVFTDWKPRVTFTDAGIAAFEKLRPDVQVVK